MLFACLNHNGLLYRPFWPPSLILMPPTYLQGYKSAKNGTIHPKEGLSSISSVTIFVVVLFGNLISSILIMEIWVSCMQSCSRGLPARTVNSGSIPIACTCWVNKNGVSSINPRMKKGNSISGRIG